VKAFKIIILIMVLVWPLTADVSADLHNMEERNIMGNGNHRHAVSYGGYKPL
jgi:hypothetical protein